MAVAPPSWVIQQLFDNDGDLLALGKLYFTAGTADGAPLAAYTDASGDTACTNPLILDSAGRCQFWLTENTAYAIVLKDANDVVIETIEQIVVSAATESAVASIDIKLLNADEQPPTENQWLFGDVQDRGVTFPANFAGSRLALNVNPTAVWTATCRKNSTAYNNGTAIGTLTVQTDGSYVFATTGGAVQSLDDADWLDWYAPAIADVTIEGFRLTMYARTTASASEDFTTPADVASAIEAYIDDLFIGSYGLWPIESLPTGWLTVTGADLSRVTYAKLFNKWGTRYGEGNGTTTFGTPSPRGRFVRIYDPTNTVDTDRASLEELQEDQFQGHFHSTILNTSPTDDGKLALEEHDSDSTTTTISTGAPITDGTNGTPRTGTETRPKNFAAVLAVYVGVNPA